MMNQMSIGSMIFHTPNFNELRKRGDIAFALGVMTILVVLVFPLPAILLDLALAMSITLSILILMTALFIQKPLEFSAFPTVLLVATMIRLSLNVASTRLILGYGHEGTHAAGKVIQAFGQFLMAGNFVIGIIVFAILIIVNFIVITKGSGRIAEVSARFTLDAMPGKQMAVDADLSSGLITEAEAKARRKELESESNFFGAMDGSAKFVRGDAIAGLLITFINIIAGIIIGVAQMDMNLGDASRTYTLLTVGDGLVTQIPALIVSTAAGILVSKSGVEGSADKALFAQLGAYPTALGLCSFLMGFLCILPQMPMLPFLILSLVTGGAAWKISKGQDDIKHEEMQLLQQQKDLETQAPKEESLRVTMDHIKIELGYGLVSLLGESSGPSLTDQIKNLRAQLVRDIGFILPSVRLQDNMHIDSNAYVIKIKELEAGRGELRPMHFLIMDPNGQTIRLEGEKTTEPTFGLPAVWITPSLKMEAETKGYTVVDNATVMTTHLTEIVKDHMGELLTFAEVQKLLEDLDDPYKKLLNDIVPAQISVGTIQRVLQNLVSERVSIRDLTSILEAIAEACAFSRNTTIITEHVRLRLMRQITYAHVDFDNMLSVVNLGPTWEQIFMEGLVGDGDVKNLALPPSILQTFITNLKQIFDDLILQGEMPVLLTTTTLRPYVRSILERIRPSTIVLGQSEVYPKVKLKHLGQIAPPR
ncbi:MAG: flagellar biosynthesis protein FlhA [Alphaproteobacteria bacterium]|nr:flagellar biosynthesis protein FlhA [Alphaproteobacteria bacterium]